MCSGLEGTLRVGDSLPLDRWSGCQTLRPHQAADSGWKWGRGAKRPASQEAPERPSRKEAAWERGAARTPGPGEGGRLLSFTLQTSRLSPPPPQAEAGRPPQEDTELWGEPGPPRVTPAAPCRPHAPLPVTPSLSPCTPRAELSLRPLTCVAAAPHAHLGIIDSERPAPGHTHVGGGLHLRHVRRAGAGDAEVAPPVPRVEAGLGVGGERAGAGACGVQGSACRCGDPPLRGGRGQRDQVGGRLISWSALRVSGYPRLPLHSPCPSAASQVDWHRPTAFPAGTRWALPPPPTPGALAWPPGLPPRAGSQSLTSGESRWPGGSGWGH